MTFSILVVKCNSWNTDNLTSFSGTQILNAMFQNLAEEKVEVQRGQEEDQHPLCQTVLK